MVDRFLTGETAQQKGTTAQWYSNKNRKKFQTLEYIIMSRLKFIESALKHLLK